MMGKKYTKRQIIESIKHWENVLNSMKHIDKKYIDFYCKKPWHFPAKSMYLNADAVVEEAIKSSYVKTNDICIYNPKSYMNIKRLNESDVIFLDEAQRTTKNTSELIEMLKSYCKKNSPSKMDEQAFNSAFNVECYDPNMSHDIYGNIMLIDFPFNVEHYPIERYINVLSRKALLLGYNYVAHNVSTIFDEDNIKCCIASIQFEASYFSSNVKTGDILYHVAPKSLTSKILRNGLIPVNKNNCGFSYDPRVYCFIDRHDQLIKKYASSSGKQSKKFVLNNNIEKEVTDLYTQIQKKTDGTLFDTHEFSLFSIDTAKLDSDVKFFRDNTFDINGNFIAVYTYEMIKPRALSLTTTFDVW